MIFEISGIFKNKKQFFCIVEQIVAISHLLINF